MGYINSAKASLLQKGIASARSSLQRLLQDVDIDSTSKLTSEAYSLLRYNTEYLLAQLPASSPALIVRLVNSADSNIVGGTLQYYEAVWKDAVNNNDGTFAVNSALTTMTLRMTYAYGSQTKSNVRFGPDPVVFQTTNVKVQLQDSHGGPMDPGIVQYYAGSWRTFGSTTGGVAQKELLPGTYSFRMTYAVVQLKNSQGNLIDQGTIQYYAGAWRSFGTTSEGSVSMELLPANYSFRMTYEYVSKDIAQEISTNNSVSFSTVLCTIRVRDAQSQLVNGAVTSYYAGAWRQIGSTVNGDVSKELLPANLTFRAAYGGKTQDLNAHALVEISMQP